MCVQKIVYIVPCSVCTCSYEQEKKIKATVTIYFALNKINNILLSLNLYLWDLFYVNETLRPQKKGSSHCFKVLINFCCCLLLLFIQNEAVKFPIKPIRFAVLFLFFPIPIHSISFLLFYWNWYVACRSFYCVYCVPVWKTKKKKKNICRLCLCLLVFVWWVNRYEWVGTYAIIIINNKTI